MPAEPRNNSLDVLRLIASFFIVIVHMPYENVNETTAGIIRLMARWAVPVFFLISGYLYQRGLEKSAVETFKKSFTKILNIFLVANLVYVPVTWFGHQKLFAWKYLVIGNYMHLWFLPSMLLGFVVIYLINKFKGGLYLSISVILLIILAALLGWSYAFVPGVNSGYFVLLRSMLSIPFMLIGGYFYKYPSLHKLLKPGICLYISMTGAILQILETLVIKNITHTPITTHQFLLGTVFFSVGLFMAALTINIKNIQLGKWGINYSLFIYLYHPLLIFLLLQITGKLHLGGVLLFLFFIPVFIITLSIGIITNKYLHKVFLLLTGSFKNFGKKAIQEA